jgi:hypothetical protein
MIKRTDYVIDSFTLKKAYFSLQGRVIMDTPANAKRPEKLADYFFQVGIPDTVSLMSMRILEAQSTINPASASQSASPPSQEGKNAETNPKAYTYADSKNVVEISIQGIGHPLRAVYEPQILCRYPLADYPDIPLPEFISMVSSSCGPKKRVQN